MDQAGSNFRLFFKHLVILISLATVLTSRFEATTRLFWNGYLKRHGPPVGDDDNAWLARRSPDSHHASERTYVWLWRSPTYDLACNRPSTTDLLWNRVSNLEPSNWLQILPLRHPRFLIKAVVIDIRDL
ncbi:hypothetical protein AVEN_137077-1 [Araneus ventricosus]|uniref:Uncharacterized protein n=1 Tax=Araneus ventricosus TaxID=182803 RepID=A0A4Y2M0Y6_ARAVE|nr:hypothetical protein AVEN_137077-1 [Araneus ventricosus]